MKRGIEDSIECSSDNQKITNTNNTTMNIMTHPHHHTHTYATVPYQTQTTSPSSSSTSSSSSSSSSTNGSSSSTSSSAAYSPNIQYMTTAATTPNGSPIIFAITPNGPIPQPQQDMISLNTMNTRPEAKKVKIQKSQPSKVVHIRNIPPQLSEIEVIQFGLIFGNISSVLNLRSKCQAFLEFEKCEEAQSMINYFTNNPITVAGRQIFVQYSNYKALITDPNNTNNQIAKAALDMAKELHKAAQTGGQNTVLRAMIQNMLYTVTLDTIYQIFSRYGPVLKIITFTKNDKYQALIQMKDGQAAQSAKNALHGQNVYSGCCTLHIDYSKLNTLNVKYNNEKSRDYTNPLLPAGDLNADPLGLGLGGILNAVAAANAAAVASPLQLSMGPPTATYTTTPHPQFASLQPTYHPHPHGQYITFPAGATKYLQAPLITPNGTLIQPQVQQQQQQQSSQQAQNLQAANGQQNVQQTNQQQQQQQQQLLIPIMQNINEDGYIMMYNPQLYTTA